MEVPSTCLSTPAVGRFARHRGAAVFRLFLRKKLFSAVGDDGGRDGKGGKGGKRGKAAKGAKGTKGGKGARAAKNEIPADFPPPRRNRRIFARYAVDHKH